MLEEIIVTMDETRPGLLAEIGELLGRSGVNIETLAASHYLERGIIHIVVDDGDDAAEVLKANGYKVDQVRPVMTATLDDRPGEFGSYCRRLSNAGVDISAVYVAHKGEGETQLIFAVDDITAAQQA
ncbi:MAG: hypothetical protein ACR2KQ_01440 [Actinomycetota bacterium]